MLFSLTGEEALEMWQWPLIGKGEECHRAQGLHWISRASAGSNRWRVPSNPMDGFPMRKEASRGKARGAQGGLLPESMAPTSCSIGRPSMAGVPRRAAGSMCSGRSCGCPARRGSSAQGCQIPR